MSVIVSSVHLCVLALMGTSDVVASHTCYGSGEEGKRNASGVLSRPTDGSSVASLASNPRRPWSTNLKALHGVALLLPGAPQINLAV